MCLFEEWCDFNIFVKLPCCMETPLSELQKQTSAGLFTKIWIWIFLMEPLTELWCVTGNDLCFKVELLWHHFVAMVFKHHGWLLNEQSASRVSWFNNHFHESELQLRGTFIKSVLILKLRTCSFSFNYVIPYGTS